MTFLISVAALFAALPEGSPAAIQGEDTLEPSPSPSLSAAAVPRAPPEQRDVSPPLLADYQLTISRRPGRAALQTTIGLLGGFVWYWRALQFNSQDFDLGWDLPTWKMKLTTLDALRFDTNDFVTNAQDHSRAGVAFYLVGRANGFNVAGSFALDVAATVAWEYLVEFRERVSINDLIVNSASGPAVGEPLLQIGRYFRRGRPTPVSRILAAVFSPFDELNGWLDKRSWQGEDETDSLGFSIERGHWLKMFATGRSVNFGTGLARSDATFGIDLEVANRRGWGVPGNRAEWTRPGDFSRMGTAFTFGDDARWLGTVFRTRTSLLGHFRQNIDADDSDTDARYGYGLFLGAGSGFDFESRTLAAEQDRLAVVNLLGPQLDLTLYGGPVVFRWQIASYGDFAMVDSHALGPETPANPVPPLTSVARAQGYYYGYGVTGFTRARLDCCWWTLDAELRAHHFNSFDERSRVESPLDAAFKNFSDERLLAVGQIAFHPWNRGLALGGFAEWVGRRGAVGPVERSSRELSVGFQAQLSH